MKGREAKGKKKAQIKVVRKVKRGREQEKEKNAQQSNEKIEINQEKKNESDLQG